MSVLERPLVFWNKMFGLELIDLVELYSEYIALPILVQFYFSIL